MLRAFRCILAGSGKDSVGLGWLEVALARSESTPSSAHARALNWLGQFEAFNGSGEHGHLETVESLLLEGITLSRQSGDNCPKLPTA